ncbi:hypothetical protein ACFLQ1_00475 [Candidatus Auribacterota bacterium]
MKAVITIMIVFTLIFGLATLPAYAGDREWATAGKILAGAIGISVLANSINNPSYSYNSHSYTTYTPAASANYWVPGHYDAIEEEVWVPEVTCKTWIQPEYAWQWHYGRRIKYLVRDGYYTYQTLPGHYEIQCKGKRWVKGYWTKRHRNKRHHRYY